MKNKKMGCSGWLMLILLLGFLIQNWWILVLIGILIIIGLIYTIKKNIKEKQEQKRQEEEYQNIEYTMETIDNMMGIEFESFVMKILLPNEGYYHIENTSYTGDYGVDIIATKDNIRCAIQCKRFNNKVTNKAIQEVVAGRKHYKCDKAIVITNNYYTKNAQELAFDNQVELLDRDDLIRMIKKRNTNQ